MMMEPTPARTERSNWQQHRIKQAVIVAVVICTMALVFVFIELVLKDRQQLRDLILLLTVPCNFFGFYSDNDLKNCVDSKIFYRYNDVASTIPSEIGLLTRMTDLTIGGAVFGTIPSIVGRLTKLKYLGIYYTQLNGTIPSALGNLTQLEWFDLKNNQLSGTIPSTLGAVVKLTEFSLSSNKLTGTIPSTLATLGQLSLMDLINNTQLYGTIPTSLCYDSTISIDCDNIACSCCISYNMNCPVT